MWYSDEVESPGLPLFVVGTIDSYGAIHAYAAPFAVHSDLRLTFGHKWRWNTHTQEWAAPRGREELTDEEEALVLNWLEERGFLTLP